MNESIQSAIEALCNDIASSTDAEENKTRAIAIAMLVVCTRILPTNATDILRTEEKAAGSCRATK